MKVEQIKEKFKIDIGTPMPTILSNEHNVYLIFYVNIIDPNWNGKTIHMRTKNDSGIVTVKFNGFAKFKFGNPNDETISGHPYTELGLKPNAVQKVLNSDWIEELRKMNAGHPYHKDEYFYNYKHYIFFFHDTCFEIIAESYSIENNSMPKMKDEIKRISELL